jgi:hypothetical protein
MTSGPDRRPSPRSRGAIRLRGDAFFPSGGGVCRHRSMSARR